MNQYYTPHTVPRPRINYQAFYPVDCKYASPWYKEWPARHWKTLIWDLDVEQRMERAGLTPRLIKIFRWAPNLTGDWHVDGSPGRAEKFAINWVYEGIGLIQWNSKVEFPQDLHANAFKSLLGGTTDPYEEQAIGDSCVVNVAIPHRVINLEPIHRISVSMQFSESISYEDGIERLRSQGFIESI